MAAGLSYTSRAHNDKPNTGRHRSRTADVIDHTEFLRCQTGGKSVINYSYTDNPLKLLMWDIWTFLSFSYALPWVVWPPTPSESAPELDELSWAPGNLFCLFVHLVLIVLQIGFLLVLIPICILLPVWMAALCIGGFLGLNWLLVIALNGNSLIYNSDPKYARASDENAHEKWIFINGVAAGEYWMKSNLDRLALTFGRPIEGIHNKTTGIIFDVIECLIQRNFGYATEDVRAAYKVVKDHLYDEKLSKVVFILHSQGGIEGSLVLDWLLQELPQDLLAKLEVYTFGCAANHFNNPHRHKKSQIEEQNSANGLLAASNPVTETALSESPVDMKTSSLSKNSTTAQSNGNGAGAGDGHTIKSHSNTVSLLSDDVPIRTTSDRVIGHIEHYAHTTDFVAIWGVLHLVTNVRASRMIPRFMGYVFSRTSSRGGHQLNQHYLEEMFPLERNAAGQLIGCKDTNKFMESIVEHEKAGTELQDLYDGVDVSLAVMRGRRASDIKPEVGLHGSFRSGDFKNREVRVADLSRLWQYR
ncbi:hypothetical protein PFICI_02228 [Pestalotiopsis fici W106-1]|uniref:DUF676 domain-containing protein n=1 Tax=Pestalotiopsis fici (strain W106-1 / CGMCC3.15140) TaxID=1229662 RepID=W3XDN1_PESFW|nr:uncharacterized protein PFICI_02228 [Pestalotiopsis fici W106-1]ETS84203.1 hypothetical protein PFICI_02228 [Pestalotiopsis fici W106-1]